VTEQLVFELATPEPPTLDNFLPGHNAEALAAIARVAAGDATETGLLLWGAPGVGKTHLLRGAVRLAVDRGHTATFVADPGALSAIDPERLAAQALVAVDAIDGAGADAQARLFTLFNALKAAGGHLVVAAASPPAALPLREDLRTRLGWGLVYEIVALADAEKPAALAAWAQRRGLRLPDDVVAYLLAHGRRDMTTLLATLAALDRQSLASKRPITVPLLREWLQREMTWSDMEGATRTSDR
jgi:DnaA family protein